MLKDATLKFPRSRLFLSSISKTAAFMVRIGSMVSLSCISRFFGLDVLRNSFSIYVLVIFLEVFGWVLNYSFPARCGKCKGPFLD
jgi:hypothetical protein